MSHQALLCAILATHPDKQRLSAFIEEAQNQIKSLLTTSHLDDDALEIFDKEIQLILRKAGFTEAVS